MNNPQEGEKVIADNGYRHERCSTPVVCSTDSKIFKNIGRARHGTVNERLKIFNCILNVFRHDLGLLGMVFHAVVNVTQLMNKNETRYFLLVACKTPINNIRPIGAFLLCM